MLEEDKARSESKFEAFLQPWKVASTVSNGSGCCFSCEDYFGGCSIGGHDSSDNERR